MSGPAIRQHLSACTEANFQEIVQIFRHDLVLYSGMLLSWAVLFGDETNDNTSSGFKRATAHFQQATQQFHDEAKSRLYPEFPTINDSRPCQETVIATWDQFYRDFAQFSRPRLDTLERQMKVYTNSPEFKTVIQQQLGAAASNEAIDQLLLQAYTKLLALLDSETFDRRIREALNSKTSAV